MLVGVLVCEWSGFSTKSFLITMLEVGVEGDGTTTNPAA